MISLSLPLSLSLSVCPPLYCNAVLWYVDSYLSSCPPTPFLLFFLPLPPASLLLPRSTSVYRFRLASKKNITPSLWANK
ncbi:hypothetical protein F4810DRAFT_664537 [Camillea tinctor]|nr:hypothetical protein F4810DRAFT_664537 [Camillea tinctor]